MFRPGSTPAGPRGGHNGAVHTPGELNTKDSRFLFLQKPLTNFMKKKKKIIFPDINVEPRVGSSLP